MIIEEPINNRASSQWYSVLHSNGKMRCSCGRQLVKIDDKTYKCEYGYPMYRFDEGEVMKDKFGNLLLKRLSHY